MSEEKIMNEETQENINDGQELHSEESTLEESGTNKAELTTDENKPYYENHYLLYGNKEKNYLDIAGTSKLLEALGFDGGQLRQARKGKETSRMFKEAEGENSTSMYCSYCGLEITGIEYERLPDDRIRCTSCSNTLVKSEMQELCDRVRANMEAFFGASINVPIHIEVLEERKLKKKIKCPISAVDDKSLLVLGAAVNDKKGYRIYLENGAPRISVIATFAHELTHIWQYINWDNKNGFPICPPDKRLLTYEGMAKWVEIQYLYLVGEAAVARREEYITRMRNDEYGVGFNLYADRYPLSYDTIICNNSPFIKNTYPIEW